MCTLVSTYNLRVLKVYIYIECLAFFLFDQKYMYCVLM